MIEIDFTPENALIVVRYGLDPAGSGFTHRAICNWCERFWRSFYDRECEPEIERILPILSDIDAQWELYLANTFKPKDLGEIDLEQVELPREWFEEWVRKLEAAKHNHE